MENEKKTALLDAMSFIGTAIQQIQQLIDDSNNSSSSNVDKDKLVEALSEAYFAGMKNIAEQMEDAEIDISLQDGCFSYSCHHNLSEFMCVENEVGSFRDEALIWKTSDVCKKIQDEFFGNDVCEES